jgi:hypothetical protein
MTEQGEATPCQASGELGFGEQTVDAELHRIRTLSPRVMRGGGQAASGEDPAWRQ